MKFGRPFTKMVGHLRSWILIVGEIHCMTAVCKAHSEMRSMSLLGGLGACPPRKILKIKGFKIEDLQMMSNYVSVDYMYSQFNNKYFVKFVNT